MEKVTVNADALFKILSALEGPPHYIREIQATRNLSKLTGTPNPIDVLIDDYNAAVATAQTNNTEVSGERSESA